MLVIPIGKRRGMPPALSLMVLGLVATAFGCATVRTSCPPLAVVERIVVDVDATDAEPDAIASGTTLATSGTANADARVTVERDGTVLIAQKRMILQRGDVVVTGKNATAVLSFAGARAMLKPDTRVELGSLKAWFGRFFVSGWLNTETRYAAGAVEGTKYYVKVDKQTQRASFTVIEGKVDVNPTEVTKATWDKVSLQRGQRVDVGKEDHEQPKTMAVPAPELEALTTEVAALDQAHAPELPQLAGKAFADVQKELRALGILARVRKVAIPHEEGSPAPLIGQVLSQSPAAGTPSDSVALTVGAKGVKVPNLEGKPRAEAAKLLKQAKLDLAEDAAAPGEPNAAPTGESVVLSQYPVAGDTVVEGMRVELRLGSATRNTRNTGGGEAESEVVVPDVSGATPEEARSALWKAGLTESMVSRPQLGVPRTRVVSQRPLPLEKAKPDQRVELVVSWPGVAVPDLAGMTDDDAVKQLGAAGLRARLSKPAEGEDATLRVVGQRPAAGETAARDATVDVVLGRAQPAEPATATTPAEMQEAGPQ